MPILGQLGMMAAGTLLGNWQQDRNNEQQLAMQRTLNRDQMQNQMSLTDYNMQKQLELWQKTGYEAQVGQLEKAGLNPALLYGKGGGGGQTAQIAQGSVNAGQASRGNEGMQGMGLGLQMFEQIKLLEAQRKNIEADTANKIAETTATSGYKTDLGKAQKDLTVSQQQSIDLQNAFNAYLQNMTPEGTASDNTGNSIAIQQKKQELLKQNSELLLNNEKMKEIAGRISLMAKQGLKEEEITNNLKKEGLIKDAEIEWNKMSLTQGDLGKFIVALIHQLIK